MKKNLKVILMTGIISVLTATIIFISGGGVAIATLLGGTGFLTIPSVIQLNDKKYNKNHTHYTEQTENIQNNNQIINKDKETYVLAPSKLEIKTRQSIAPIKQYDENLSIQKLITIDAFSQKENILVRTRKKETKENNNYKNKK